MNNPEFSTDDFYWCLFTYHHTRENYEESLVKANIIHRCQMIYINTLKWNKGYEGKIWCNGPIRNVSAHL